MLTCPVLLEILRFNTDLLGGLPGKSGFITYEENHDRNSSKTKYVGRSKDRLYL